MYFFITQYVSMYAWQVIGLMLVVVTTVLRHAGFVTLSPRSIALVDDVDGICLLLFANEILVQIASIGSIGEYWRSNFDHKVDFVLMLLSLSLTAL